eukprot:1349542-Amorphochlora_amoeboformis.AAC.1
MEYRDTGVVERRERESEGDGMPFKKNGYNTKADIERVREGREGGREERGRERGERARERRKGERGERERREGEREERG